MLRKAEVLIENLMACSCVTFGQSSFIPKSYVFISICYLRKEIFLSVTNILALDWDGVIAVYPNTFLCLDIWILKLSGQVAELLILWNF